jgi:hypothetical protein
MYHIIVVEDNGDAGVGWASPRCLCLLLYVFSFSYSILQPGLYKNRYEFRTTCIDTIVVLMASFSYSYCACSLAYVDSRCSACMISLIPLRSFATSVLYGCACKKSHELKCIGSYRSEGS